MTKTSDNGFPSKDPTASYWQTSPAPFADHGADAALPEHCDYIIVGSGVAGSSLALKLLQRDPNAKVVMLEARQAVSGATGRNGGHCRGGMYACFAEDSKTVGVEEALRIQRFEAEDVSATAAFVRAEGIDCDFRDLETADVFTSAEPLAPCRQSLDALAHHFAGNDRPAWLPEYRYWEGAEAQRHTGFVDALAAVTFPGHALHPYKFTCAVLRKALDSGLSLYTHTRVVAVTPPSAAESETKWTVATERGAVRAQHVLLATNAYTTALYPPIAPYLTPTRGQMLALRPGSKAAGSAILGRTFGLYNGISEDYCQTRADGDVVLLGGGRMFEPKHEQPVLDDATVSPIVSSYLGGAMAKSFGRAAWGEEQGTVMEWTGIMGYTNDGRPFVGEAPGQPGLWLCCGFNGHGMALAFAAAEAVVQLLNGDAKVHEWLPKSFGTARIVA